MVNRSKLFVARLRVRKVAQGGTINGAYRLGPIDALKAFRDDLTIILDFVEEAKNGEV
jgi:hypothetical protein